MTVALIVSIGLNVALILLAILLIYNLKDNKKSVNLVVDKIKMNQEAKDVLTVGKTVGDSINRKAKEKEIDAQTYSDIVDIVNRKYKSGKSK